MTIYMLRSEIGKYQSIYRYTAMSIKFSTFASHFYNSKVTMCAFSLTYKSLYKKSSGHSHFIFICSIIFIYFKSDGREYGSLVSGGLEYSIYILSSRTLTFGTSNGYYVYMSTR